MDEPKKYAEGGIFENPAPLCEREGEEVTLTHEQVKILTGETPVTQTISIRLDKREVMRAFLEGIPGVLRRRVDDEKK